jgi:hypothetical protein
VKELTESFLSFIWARGGEEIRNPKRAGRLIQRHQRPTITARGCHVFTQGSFIIVCDGNDNATRMLVIAGGCYGVLFFATLCLVPIFALLEVPIWFDSSNGGHRSIKYHPEQPARIDACIKSLQPLDGAKLIDTTPDPSTLWKDTAHFHEPFSTEELDHARDMLLKTHDDELVLTLEGRCRKGRQIRIEEGRDPLGFIGYIDDDTFLTTESFDVCLRATAAWIRAVDYALKENSAAFALTRPPGHHATFKLSNGFCLLNFAAAAVIHALETNPNIRVSIFDWDVHYGMYLETIVVWFG